jgi:hypothetical protein
VLQTKVFRFIEMQEAPISLAHLALFRRADMYRSAAARTRRGTRKPPMAVRMKVKLTDRFCSNAKILASKLHYRETAPEDLE